MTFFLISCINIEAVSLTSCLLSHLLGRNNQLLGFACCQSSCSVSFEAKQQARWKLEAITDCVVYKNYFLVYAGAVFIWCDPYDKQYTCTIDLAVGQCSCHGKTVEQWRLERLCCLTRRHPEKLACCRIHVVKNVTLFFYCVAPAGARPIFLIRSQGRWKGQSALCFFPFWG